MMTLYFGDGFIDDNELYLLVMTNDSCIADWRFVDPTGLNRDQTARGSLVDSTVTVA